MKKINFAFLAMVAIFSSNSAIAGNLKGKLLLCADVNDSLERLVCYDNLAKKLNSKNIKVSKKIAKPTESVAKVTAPVITKKVMTKTEKDFGADHLRKTDADRAAELNEVIFTISKLSTNKYDRKLITFTNGQNWKQTDDTSIRLAVNDKVQLTKGVFGVVFLKKMNNNRKIKIRRLK